MDFIAKPGKNKGEFVFASQTMEIMFWKMMDFHKKTDTYFRFTLEEPPKKTTQAQRKLFDRLVYMVSDESGDTFHEVKKNLLKNFAPYEPTPNTDLLGEPIKGAQKELEELTYQEFQQLLLDSVSFCNDYFNMNIELHTDDEIGSILTNKKK